MSSITDQIADMFKQGADSVSVMGGVPSPNFPKTIRLTLTSTHLVQIAEGKTITFKAGGTILELRK